MKTKSPSEIWNEIGDKAQYYKTAYFNGQCVGIVRIVTPGTFEIKTIPGEVLHVGCQELTDYCL